MDKYNAILNALNELDNSSIVSLWNEYLENNHYSDDYIHTNDDESLNKELEGYTPMQIAEDTRDWNSSDDYFIHTIYGIESFNYPLSYIEIEKLIDFSKTENYLDEADLANAFAEQYQNEFGSDDNVEDWATMEDLFFDDWDELAVTYNEEEKEDC